MGWKWTWRGKVKYSGNAKVLDDDIKATYKDREDRYKTHGMSVDAFRVSLLTNMMDAIEQDESITEEIRRGSSDWKSKFLDLSRPMQESVDDYNNAMDWIADSLSRDQWQSLIRVAVIRVA